MYRIEYLAEHPEAVEVLAGWLFDEWGHRSPDGTVEGVAANLRGRMQRDKLPLALVALDGDAPLGTVSLKIREVEILPQYEHWLGTLFVAKGHRRKGVGTRLVEAVREQASRLGIEALYLYTRQEETRHFYERLGWVELERVEYEGRSAIIMKLVVDEESR